MGRRSWTNQEIKTLRELYPYLHACDVAAALGRSQTAVKSAAGRFGIAVSRRWTAEHKAVVRQWYGRKPAAEIGRLVGRSERSVYKYAERFGLTRRYAMTPKNRPVFDAYIREKHAEEWTDTDIAAGFGCERHAVSRRRKELGLEAQTWSKRSRDRVRRKTAEQLRTLGFANLAELRSHVFRQRARAAGWPEDLKFREVEILNALWDRGPLTKRQLVEVLGMPWRGSRKSLCGAVPRGSYLAHLASMGLVVRMPRKARCHVSGNAVDLYTLPLTIQRRMPA